MPRSTSSRRKNKWQQPPRDLSDSVAGMRVSRDLPDGSWSVQKVAGNSHGKVYVCPGCGQDVPSSSSHIVAWRQEAGHGIDVGVDSRRHWHTRCFQRFR
ncbi:hypothetical protein [Brevibacterium sp. ZH18]|uniref:hypothetical protein n=1 Tax=Brevibacterium sp. ZH18 TaxID=2927784 RepID=UPI001F60E5CA|nr:hypothetical protein [Brevibacterium sp. ZH18]MCI4009901.1 hypothetical protein [Brevibacterium sp. ZH18]